MVRSIMNTHGETSPVLMPDKPAKEAPLVLSQVGRSDFPIIPDHELLRRIGEGSFGEVWLARNKLGTLRAVKIVNRRNFEDRRPFEREFKGIQKFEPISRSHEGLVDILQVGGAEDYFYCVMELADDANVGSVSDQSRTDATQAKPQTGKLAFQLYTPRTLRCEAKQRGRLQVGESVSIGQALANALAHLHAQGLVHRDVKPSNIIFVGGVPKLADIGLVADASESRSFVGTEGFIPPEGPGAAQADLYSLGKVLYEISTGSDRRDFPVLPDDLAEDEAMLELNAIILKACKLDVRERYQSAAEVASDLALLQQGKSVKRKRALQYYWAASRRAALMLSVLTVVVALNVVLLRRPSDSDLHSTVPGVDELVAQGDLYLVSGTPERLDQAWAAFNGAVQKDTNFALGYVGLWEVCFGRYGGLGNVSADAESNLRADALTLIEKAPNLAETKMASSFLKYLDGHLDAAMEDARQAAKMRPGSKENGGSLVHSLYGWYLLNAGRPEDAMRQYLLANQVSKGASPSVQRHLGQACFAMHDFTNALAYVQKSLDLEPRQVLGHVFKANIYEETGQFEKAIAEFELRDELSGRNEPETKLFYDDLRAAVKRDPIHGFWEESLKKALGHSPENYSNIAFSLAHLGRMDEAYDRLKIACEKGQIENLWSELCWSHEDERFKRIAQKIGMKP
jgi:serine/threonine protein kinase/tetratricopeptide (TPR) repeat protein